MESDCHGNLLNGKHTEMTWVSEGVEEGCEVRDAARLSPDKNLKRWPPEQAAFRGQSPPSRSGVLGRCSHTESRGADIVEASVPLSTAARNVPRQG